MFIDVLTTELRKQSRKHYLFEEVSRTYKQSMIQIFQKAINDELSASSVYFLVGSKLSGFEGAEIQEKFIEHAREEYEHFTELVKYAADHGIINNLEIGLMDYTQNYPDISNLQDIIQWKQDLETEARDDYLNAAKLAEKEGDTLTVEFFKELATDENRHLTDLFKYTGEVDEF